DAAGHIEIGLWQFVEGVVRHAIAAHVLRLCAGEKWKGTRERDGQGGDKRDGAIRGSGFHDAAPLARLAVPDSFARNDVACSARSSSIAASKASPFSRVASVGSPKLPERL